MRDREEGSQWVSVWDTGAVPSQITQLAYRGSGILRAVVALDGNSGGTGAAVTNIFDGVMSGVQISVPGIVPQIGRPLFIAGSPPDVGGFLPVTGLNLRFDDGLIVSFRGDNVSFTLLVFDPL